MYNLIVKLARMYKVFNFKADGSLEINYNGSSFVLSKSGDIIINAKRHIIYNRVLSFDGCKSEFIEKTIEANEEGKLEEHLRKEYIDLEIKAEILKCRQEQ